MWKAIRIWRTPQPPFTKLILTLCYVRYCETHENCGRSKLTNEDCITLWWGVPRLLNCDRSQLLSAIETLRVFGAKARTQPTLITSIAWSWPPEEIKNYTWCSGRKIKTQRIRRDPTFKRWMMWNLIRGNAEKPTYPWTCLESEEILGVAPLKRETETQVLCLSNCVAISIQDSVSWTMLG